MTGMTLDGLYELAENENIDIDTMRLPNIKTISAHCENNYYIGIDLKELHTTADERVCLAHELGHCMTGCFYNIDSPLRYKGWHEHRANKWAVHRLVPLQELKKELSGAWNAPHEIAEHFSVTADFIHLAIYIYYCEGKL